MRKDLVERFGEIHPAVPFFVTIPHSGEVIPNEADWLREIPKIVLDSDLDRFVDLLMRPISESLSIPVVMTHVHRYASDLNRFPTDVDLSSVEGSPNPVGRFAQGFHWVRSTDGVELMKKPITASLHEICVKKYHDPFHEEIGNLIGELRSKFKNEPLYQIELHSMPSQGTSAHQDEGRARPEITVSDVMGKSSQPEFKDRVIEAFRNEGLEVAENWPYQGGRNTQRYGKPALGHHCIQIEMNRKLYLNEETHTRKSEKDFTAFQDLLKRAFSGLLGK